MQNPFADIPHLAQEQLNQPSSIELPNLSVEDRPRPLSAAPEGPKRTLAREDLPVLFVKTPLR